MSTTHPVIPAAAARARVNQQQYRELYRKSLSDNEGFWAGQARRINWIKPFSRVKDVSFRRDDLHIRWFEDGTLNACANCVDRHLPARGDQVAIIWEGDDPATSTSPTASCTRAFAKWPTC
jgi:acetyl-CoA synthetase